MALVLLVLVNLLVILVPNIRDIFGVTGQTSQKHQLPFPQYFGDFFDSGFLPLPGATTAPSLIFILPGLFYIRIIPANQEPLNSRPKIQVGTDVSRCHTQRGQRWRSDDEPTSVVTFELILLALFVPPGCMFHSSGLRLHDHEPDLHWTGLDQWTQGKPQRPLSQGAFLFQLEEEKTNPVEGISSFS